MVKVISKVSAGRIRKGETITLSKEDAEYWIAKGLAEPVQSEKPIKAPVINPPHELFAEIIEKGEIFPKATIEIATAKQKAEKARIKPKRKRK